MGPPNSNVSQLLTLKISSFWSEPPTEEDIIIFATLSFIGILGVEAPQGDQSRKNSASSQMVNSSLAAALSICLLM